MAMLAFEATTKRYGRRTALDSLTLTVEPGEIYGFLGPNGAGKTTAIHLALGFLRATSGGGRLADRPFGDRRARARVGFVPDAPVFFAGSSMEAMTLAGRMNYVPESEIAGRSRALLRLLDLPARGTEARKFSRGMQQRLAMAQAWLSRPPVLLLDEPTAALDPPSVVLVRALLDEARSEGAAIFFSSHQLGEVEQLCDRVGFLSAGRLVRTGRVDELLRERAVVLIRARGVARPDAELSRWPSEPVRTSETDRTWTVPLEDQRPAIEAIWSAGGELVSVERQKPTLEELFFEHQLRGAGGQMPSGPAAQDLTRDPARNQTQGAS